MWWGPVVVGSLGLIGHLDQFRNGFGFTIEYRWCMFLSVPKLFSPVLRHLGCLLAFEIWLGFRDACTVHLRSGVHQLVCSHLWVFWFSQELIGVSSSAQYTPGSPGFSLPSMIPSFISSCVFGCWSHGYQCPIYKYNKPALIDRARVFRTRCSWDSVLHVNILSGT